MTNENEVQENEIPVQEEHTQQEDNQQTSQVIAKPSENWEKANEVLKAQRQQIEELRAQVQQMAYKPVVEEKDEFDELDQDDAMTVGQARKLAEKLSEKKAKAAAKEMVEQYIKQQSVITDESLARSKYEDYDYVVENYAIPLIKNDPALAYKVQNSPNPALTAYKLGKLSDHYEEANMPQKTSPKAEKVLKNNSRPVSSNAVGSPLKNEADKYTNMSKQDIWEESQKYSRRA
jgi:hypothetical protein